MGNSVAIKDTVVESIYGVLPEHANSMGMLHGGYMMNWMVTTAALAAVKLSRGSATLGALDSIFFINPVKIGSMVLVRSWVEYVGRASMEIGVEAHSENPLTGESALTTLSHMAFVATDARGEPREVHTKIRPREQEREIYEQALKRWENRRRSIEKRREYSLDISEYAPDSRWRRRVSRIVLADDALYGEYMFGGKMLLILDELAGTLASRYCRGIVLTGSVDGMVFYYPIRVGDIIDIEVALNHVGRASLEVGAKIITENPYTGRRRHASTAHLTFVHIGGDGRPSEVPPYRPETENELTRWREAEERRKNRRIMIEQLQQRAELNKTIYE